MRVKNWDRFQHFKDRRPPWIKLYRDLLDDIQWHELGAEAAKALVMLWVIASEDEGNLPDVKTLAFRLRMTEKQVRQVVSKLTHWLEQDDITAISGRHSIDIPETETETETEKRQTPVGFDAFWNLYRRKDAKGRAEKALRAALKLASIETIIDGLKRYQWAEDKRFWPLPATWLNDRRWEDAGPAALAAPSLDPEAAKSSREQRIVWAISKGIVNNLDATEAEVRQLVDDGRITVEQASKVGYRVAA